MLNWIVWNRIDYLIKRDLSLNNLQRLIYHKAQTTNQQTFDIVLKKSSIFVWWYWSLYIYTQTSILQYKNGWFSHTHSDIYIYISCVTSISYKRVYIYIYIYIYIYPSARSGCGTRSIFKRNLTKLNSEFSFSKTGSHTKVKESNLSYN